MSAGSAVKHMLAAALMCALALPAAAAAPKESQCAWCHSHMRRDYIEMVEEWRVSIHAAQGVGCEGCHGGNPDETDFDKAMYGVPGFTARWAKRDIPAMCASCHSDPVKMRPYHIPTDQLQQYRQSAHGKALLEKGDTNVAVCTDCHGVHDTRATDDPESRVFKTNIPQLCASCHSDPKLMQRYGLPGDEYDQYVASVHGRKLLQEGERAAPSCPDCHGAHGATPPGVEEVPAVCGRCHARTQQDFNRGPHLAAVQTAGIPRCVDCHGYHGVKLPTDAMLIGDEPGHCGACHEPGSAARRAGVEIHRLITRQAQQHQRSAHLVNRAREAAMDVSDLHPQLDQAETAVIEARVLQHTCSVEAVRDKVAEAGEVLAAVDGAARQALAESRHRRAVALGAALAFMVGAFMIWLKRRQLMGELPPSA